MKKIVPLLVFLTGSLLAQQPPGTEILLFDLKQSKNSIQLLNPKNITNRTGYDNQPHFHPEKPLVYFSSADESGRTDIMVYDHVTGETTKLTDTSEREYSPTVTPDGKFISCIIQRDNGAQDLGKYPIEGGEPVVIIDNLIVGYHTWINDDVLLLFVLGRPNTLRLYSISEKKDLVLAENIGRSLHRIPGTNDISFIDKQDVEWQIKKYNSKNGTIETIAPTLPNREDMAWTKDGKILMSDGVNLFFIQPNKYSAWSRVTLPKGMTLQGISRLAINASSSKITIVIDEIKN
ncbi:MAG: PD40 domain-containing protein [Cyclobacteriaceae bacterium]|nr:PD40 domain-containing protein [Cyclobacteriaceae bacterium]